jgi:hypothetical protein
MSESGPVSRVTPLHTAMRICTRDEGRSAVLPPYARLRVLAAKSIVYADPAKGGLSAVYFARVLERLGIADQMRPKTFWCPATSRPRSSLRVRPRLESLRRPKSFPWPELSWSARCPETSIS